MAATRVAAAVLLMAAGSVIGMWFWHNLFGQRAEVRRRVYLACTRPGKFKPEEARAIGPDAIPFLIEWLQVQDTPTRRLRVKIGKKLPAWLHKHWPDLPDIEQLHDRAAWMLKELGPAAKPAVPDLIRFLQTEKRFSAVDALEAIGPDAAEALPALHSAWTNGNTFFKFRVAETIWSVGRETNAIQNYCQAGLTQTNDKEADIEALIMAGKLDEASRETLAAVLVNRLQDTAHPKARTEAVLGLRLLAVATESVQNALLQGAKDSDQAVRLQCAVTLWKLWPTNAACASLGTRAILDLAVKEEFRSVPVNFGQRVKNLELDSTTAIPVLKECLNDDDPKIRLQAAKALESINSPSSSPEPRRGGS
jgi:hypothetical protein